MGAATVGEIGSFALATPAAVAVGGIGFTAFIDGLSNFAFSAVDFAIGLANCFTDNTSVNGDLLPANLGGAIGAGIDQKNGFYAEKQNKKGPAQVKGEKINGAFTFAFTFSGYCGSVVETGTTGTPASVNQIINEVSHQYDVYNNTKLMLEREE